MKYFKRAEKVWKKVYKDETMMVDLYRGFDKWLNIYGRQMVVSKNSSKSLFLVVATWTAKDDEDNDNSAETEEVEPMMGATKMKRRDIVRILVTTLLALHWQGRKRRGRREIVTA
jgi:hypothetical protein